MKIFQIISNIFHPMNIMTYAALLVCFFTPVLVLPLGMRIFIVVEVFFYTCLIPILTCILLQKLKIISDWRLHDRKERNIPLIASIICYITCAVALTYQRTLPFWALVPFYGSIVTAIIAWIVSFWWKISGHALGMSSLMTMAWAYFFMFDGYFIPIFIPFLLIILLGLICSIRVYLGRHNLSQVYVGSAVGMGVTVLVYSIVL
ncbi:MAG: hypothetical protein HUJ97_09710 [Bacteroidales bacterium]|nr:hypothetical protein [Bacteroidales bacterium]